MPTRSKLRKNRDSFKIYYSSRLPRSNPQKISFTNEDEELWSADDESPEESEDPDNYCYSKPRAINSPSIVRSSFIFYLRSDFPYKMSWTHPYTKEKHSHELIYRRLLELKSIDPKGYTAFWYLWSTQGTRVYIAERLHCSGTTLKRLWDKCVDKLLLMMWFPDLIPEAFVLENKLS